MCAGVAKSCAERARQCKKTQYITLRRIVALLYISPLQLCFIQLFGTISQLATTHTLQTERRYCFRPCDMFTQTPPASSPMNLCGGSGISELLSNFTFKSSLAASLECLPHACTCGEHTFTFNGNLSGIPAREQNKLRVKYKVWTHYEWRYLAVILQSKLLCKEIADNLFWPVIIVEMQSNFPYLRFTRLQLYLSHQAINSNKVYLLLLVS